MPKRATKVILSEKEQEELLQITKRHRSGQQGIDLETLSRAERLQDAPRPGATAKITAEQRCQIAAVACGVPIKAGRPISQWTGREIADELKARGIVPEISPRHASYVLKKGGSERTISLDELTGIQALERKHPALPMQIGHVALAGV